MTPKQPTLSALLFALTTLVGCGGGSAGTSTPTVTPQTEPPTNTGTDPATDVVGAPDICTTEGFNAWVDAQMRDYYIYADQVPVVNPSSYDDAQALLNDLRVAPDVFSNISPQAERAALFDEGETFGFGFNWRTASDGQLRFSNIISGSPLDLAGAQRGDRVIALNDIPIASITDNVFNELFGETGTPTTLTFTTQRGDDAPVDLTVTSTTYVINTVGEYGTYDVFGTTVGYIDSASFLRTSEQEIDTAIEFIADRQATEVILDFRYNGGGYVYIAQKFAAQLLGSVFEGNLFQSTEFNSRYSQFNRLALFEAQELNLNVNRVFVLTTGRTASAAEAIANNLRPYIDVVLVGSRTSGKPFASVSNPNCDQVLNAMDRITYNAAGESVLGGLAPDCAIVDDFLHPKNSTQDALLSATLFYLQTNVCPAVNNPFAMASARGKAGSEKRTPHQLESYQDADWDSSLASTPVRD